MAEIINLKSELKYFEKVIVYSNLKNTICFILNFIVV